MNLRIIFSYFKYNVRLVDKDTTIDWALDGEKWIDLL